MNAECWICLEGDESDCHVRNKDDNTTGAIGKLCRDCACRGESAGYAHLPCLTKYIKEKIDETFQTNSHDDHGKESSWERILMECPHCLSPYRGSFSVDIANAYVTMTSNYKDNDPRRIVAQLNLATKIIYENPDEAKSIYMRLLKAIRSSTMMIDNKTIGHFEVSCLLGLANACEANGDSKGASLYLQFASKKSEENGYDSEHQISLQMQWLNQRSSGANIGDCLHLGTSQLHSVQERFQNKFGHSHEVTMLTELAFAEALFEEGNDISRATSLIKDIVKKSIQTLGLSHQTTVKCMLRYGEMLARIKKLPYATICSVEDISISTVWKGRRVIIAPPIDEMFVCISIDESKCKMATLLKSTEIILCDGTKVTWHGISKGKDCHINGKRATIKSYHSNKKRYILKVEGDSKRHSVKLENVTAIFEDIA